MNMKTTTPQITDDTPFDMMTRVFELANLVVNSESYKVVRNQREKHKSVSMIYAVEQMTDVETDNGKTETN